MKYNVNFFRPLSGSEFEFFALPLVASLLGSDIAAASSNGEACGRASSRSAELLKFIPLCILQYPPFFLPLSKQQASRHLGYFKFVPPRSTPPPPAPLPPRFTRTHAHIETTLKGNGSVFLFFSASFFFSNQSSDFGFEKKIQNHVPSVALESKRKRLLDCRRSFF